MRFLASLVVFLALAAQGCSGFGKTCSLELRGYQITMQRRVPGVRVADVTLVQGCVRDRCGNAKLPDASGLRTFDTGFGQGDVRLTDVDGQLSVDAHASVGEGDTPLTIRLLTTGGTTHVVSGAIEWNDDGCHLSPVATKI